MTVSYVALLRGVNNAGPSRRVAMADLRALFESLGFRDVRTLLNSGNVIFSAADQAPGKVLARIEKGLASRLGLTSPVTLLSSSEVAAAVRGNPFSDFSAETARLLVAVPRTRADLGRLRPLLKERWAPEALAVSSRVGCLWCANGAAKSPLWAAVDRALERSGTVRNMATFTKAMSLLENELSYPE
jgi:uncharacterized protein (DUF1697 family)